MIIIETILNFLKDRNYRHLLFTTISILLVGSLVFHYLEGWNYIDSLYFSIITLTTIGYGDFSPQTDAGKIFTIFYIIVGVGVILAFINTVFNHYKIVAFRKKDDRSNTKEY